MMEIMKNKWILITGATSGIGLASARKFATEGYNLVLFARRFEKLEEIKIELEKQLSIKVIIKKVDVRDRKQIQDAIIDLPAIDILLNNAGLAKGVEKIQEGVWEKWEQMIDTNIKGLLAMTRAILPKMIEQNKGHIINIGSIAGHETYPGGNVYNATKFGVNALTRAIRQDLHGYNIRCSSVDPGMVDTEFSIVRLDDEQKAKKVYEGFEPLHAEDIAETIYFVASRPPHVNIQDVVIMPQAQASATVVNRKT